VWWWLPAAAVAALALLATAAPAQAHYVHLEGELVRPGVFTFGVALTGPPFAYKRDGKLEGFEIAVARAVADSNGLELHVVELPRDELAAALKAGKADAVNTLALAAQPPDTRTVPYLVVGDHVMILRGNPFRIRRLEDLQGRIVAATAGTTAEVFARALNRRFQAEGKAPMDIHSFPFQRDTPFPVNMGHAAAYFIQTVSAVAISQDPEARTRMLPGGFRPVREVGFAMRAENGNIHHAIEHAMAAMVATGKYQRLRETYHLPTELSPYKKGTF
jgi:ABC-type amino acid transport substrate-binding protein